MRRCPLCGNAETARHGVKALARCPACRLVFAAGTEYRGEIYDAAYFAARGHDVGSEEPGIAHAKRLTFRHYLGKLAAPAGGEPRRLLEIGCSTGLGLLEAAALGWEVHGVDVSEAAVAAARARVPQGDVRLSTGEFPAGHFQALVMLDVIEHFAAPEEIGPELERLAAPGGELLLVTPDVESLSARWMGARWPHYLDEHLNYYSRRSLEEFLRRHGFRLREAGWAGKYVTFSMLRRHAQTRGGVFDSLARSLLRPLELAAGRLPFWFNLGELYAVAVRAR